MIEPKPCPVGNKRCLCANCQSNANLDGCDHGYYLHCFECIYNNRQMHDVYLCTGHQDVFYTKEEEDSDRYRNFTSL